MPRKLVLQIGSTILVACSVSCNHTKHDGKANPAARDSIEQIVTSNSIIEVQPNSAVQDLLTGYDSLTGGPKPTCVIRIPGSTDKENQIFATPSREPTSKDSDLSTRYVLTDVINARSMRTSVLHSLQASFDYAGTGSIEGISQSSNESTYSQYSRYLSIDAIAEKQTRYNTNVQLTRQAARLWANPDSFRRLCGDRYIAAIVKGSSFSAIVTFDASSASEDDAVSTALKASARGASASEADMQKIHSATASATQSVQIITKAVSGDIDSSFEGIIAASKRLRTDAARSNVAVREIALPYPPPDSNTLSRKQENTLEALADQAITVRKRINSIDFILDGHNSDDFPGLSPKALRREKEKDESVVSGLLQRANACAKDINVCSIPKVNVPDLPSRPLWVPISTSAVQALTGTASLFVSDRDYPAKVQFDNGQWRFRPGSPEGWMTVNSSTHLQWNPNPETNSASGGADNLIVLHWYEIPPFCTVALRFFANPQKDAEVNPALPPSWRRYDDIPLETVTVTDN